MKDIAKNVERYLGILFLFIIVVTALTLFGKKGLIAVYHLNQECKQLIFANEELKEQNRKLEHEVRLLRSNHQYIEKIAREELGLVKNREIVYQFKKK